jgi:hypothetical protein
VQIQQTPLFDYDSLDIDTRSFVQEKTQAIHARLKRTAEDIVAIGQDLIEVRDRLACVGRGGLFHPWLRAEFDMARRMAYNFISVAERFGDSNCAKFAQLPVSVLYELAAPSTPESVIEMVEAKQIEPTISAIREAKQEISRQEAEKAQQQGVERTNTTPTETPTTLWRPPSQQEDNHEEHVFTEEEKYHTAADTGTLDYYYDNLRRESIAREQEAPVESLQQSPSPEETVEPVSTHFMQIMSSSETPEWNTPQHIIHKVISFFGEIDLDPCSNSHETPNVPAHIRYAREDDGLAKEWAGRVYMNPPYGSEIGKWTGKLVESFTDGSVQEAIALVPGRIDTAWFQPLYNFLICNIRGRLQFGESQTGAPFPSVLVYMGDRREDFIAHFKTLGPIVERVA